MEYIVPLKGVYSPFKGPGRKKQGDKGPDGQDPDGQDPDRQDPYRSVPTRPFTKLLKAFSNLFNAFEDPSKALYA